RHAHLAQHVLHVAFSDTCLAAHGLDQARHAVGKGGGHGEAGWMAARRTGPRKYTVRMILSLGPGLPVVAALVAFAGYAVAAPPGAGRRLAPRRGAGRGRGAAWASGGLAHAAPLAIDIAGVGDSAPGARFGFAPVL